MKEALSNEASYLRDIKNGMSLKYVPQRQRTKKLCMAALEKSGVELKFVPEKMKNIDLCSRAFNHTVAAYRYIPDRYKTEEMAYRTVSIWGSWLKYVPYAHRTYKVCLQAMRKRGNLEDVPLNVLTKELIRVSIQHNARNTAYALTLNIREVKKTEIPESETQSFQDSVKNGFFLNVPSAEEDEVKALGAVWNSKRERWVMRQGSNPRLFRRWLPKAFFPEDEERKAKAVQTVRKGQEEVRKPEEKSESELQLFQRVLTNPMALRDISEERRTLAVCEAAVRKNVVALHYVPVDDEHMPIFVTALLEKRVTKTQLPQPVLRECRLAERIYESSLFFASLSSREKSPCICQVAVKRDPRNIRYVPRYFKDNYGNLLEYQEMLKVFRSDALKQENDHEAFLESLEYARKKLKDMVAHDYPSNDKEPYPEDFYNIIFNLRKEIEDCHKQGYSMKQIANAINNA
ncbi:MAG: hypothetical protein IKO41_17685 [Lachnospiraceae bacterium]|nr:hypothetical protein [Lachnospiraceae bacterium]